MDEGGSLLYLHRSSQGMNSLAPNKLQALPILSYEVNGDLDQVHPLLRRQSIFYSS
jgi:hypothetical protein